MLQRQLMRVEKLAKILESSININFSDQKSLNHLINNPTEIITKLCEGDLFDDAVELAEYEFLDFQEIILNVSSKLAVVKTSENIGMAENLTNRLVKNNFSTVNLLAMSDEEFVRYPDVDRGVGEEADESEQSEDQDQEAAITKEEEENSADQSESESDPENFENFPKPKKSLKKPININSKKYSIYTKLLTLKIHDILTSSRNSKGQARNLLEILMKNLIKNGLNKIPHWLVEKFSLSSSLRVLVRAGRINQALVLASDLFERNLRKLEESHKSDLEIIPWKIVTELIEASSDSQKSNKNKVSLNETSEDLEYLESLIELYLKKLEEIEQLITGRQIIQNEADKENENMPSGDATRIIGRIEPVNNNAQNSSNFGMGLAGFGGKNSNTLDSSMEDGNGEISLDAPFAFR